MAANLHLAHISDVLLTWAVFSYAFAMFGCATSEIVGDADVQRSVLPARHDVDVVRLVHSRRAAWVARVRGP